MGDFTDDEIAAIIETWGKECPTCESIEYLKVRAIKNSSKSYMIGKPFIFCDKDTCKDLDDKFKFTAYKWTRKDANNKRKRDDDVDMKIIKKKKDNEDIHKEFCDKQNEMHDDIRAIKKLIKRHIKLCEDEIKENPLAKSDEISK